ncbi:hypothetical protein [Clostridioides difficile]|uniref:hypothetical protein n=2 Tax=Clostridioides difficile TaxID=1496 RepID=UPI00031B0114|nr:hypothetical protein [Clostridioides difficile]SJT12992.1 Uncharacterised protein [Clostridioides difficile]SJT31285.1 Uncharacterised protein [Clostridioides difficile]SJT78886.1 Uncharacterised protein [Clostridioides difficile]
MKSIRVYKNMNIRRCNFTILKKVNAINYLYKVDYKQKVSVIVNTVKDEGGVLIYIYMGRNFDYNEKTYKRYL